MRVPLTVLFSSLCMNSSMTCISTCILRTMFCSLARCAWKKVDEMGMAYDDFRHCSTTYSSKTRAAAGFDIRMGPAALSHVTRVCTRRIIFHAPARYVPRCLESDLDQQ